MSLSYDQPVNDILIQGEVCIWQDNSGLFWNVGFTGTFHNILGRPRYYTIYVHNDIRALVPNTIEGYMPMPHHSIQNFVILVLNNQDVKRYRLTPGQMQAVTYHSTIVF